MGKLSPPVVLQELGGAKRRLILIGTDLPFSTSPMSFGVKHRSMRRYYAGAPEPTVQHFGPEELPVAWAGRFQDRNTLPGQAVGQARLLEDMARAGHPVRLSFGTVSRRCIWVDFRWTPIEPEVIAYQIHLHPVADRDVVRRLVGRENVIPRMGEVLNGVNAAITLTQGFPTILESAAQQVRLTLEGVFNRLTSVDGELVALRERTGSDRRSRATGLLADADGASRDLGIAFRQTQQIDPAIVSAGTVFDRERTIGAGVRALRREIINSRRSIAIVRPRLGTAAGDPITFSIETVRDGISLQRIALARLNAAEDAARLAAANGLITWSVGAGDRLCVPGVPTPDAQSG